MAYHQAGQTVPGTINNKDLLHADYGSDGELPIPPCRETMDCDEMVRGEVHFLKVKYYV